MKKRLFSGLLSAILLLSLLPGTALAADGSPAAPSGGGGRILTTAFAEAV